MPAFEWWTNATRDTVKFVRRYTKHNKDKHTRREPKERKFETKVREIFILIFM